MWMRVTASPFELFPSHIFLTKGNVVAYLIHLLKIENIIYSITGERQRMCLGFFDGWFRTNREEWVSHHSPGTMLSSVYVSAPIISQSPSKGNIILPLFFFFPQSHRALLINTWRTEQLKQFWKRRINWEDQSVYLISRINI